MKRQRVANSTALIIYTNTIMYNAYSTSNLINQFVEDHADQLDMSDNDYINTVLINDVIEDTKDLGSDGFYQAFSFTIKDVENYIDTYCNNLTTN